MKHIKYKLWLVFVTCFCIMANNNIAHAGTVYGALWEVGNLTAASEINKESVVMYYPAADGFITVTNRINDAQQNIAVEWWTSDKFGLNWQRAEQNPLTEYNCTMVGRHAVEIYNNEMYFGANCANNAVVFKLTSLNTVELLHTLEADTTTTSLDTPPNPDPNQTITLSYPTATILNNKLYLFFNGGYSVFDGTIWQDVTNASNQPTAGVPLEASSETNGLVYVAFTSGEVASFDGNSYTIIGTSFLENLSMNDNANLPAIEVYNNHVYVGNQDMTNGASIFKYDNNTWTSLVQLDSTDRIINKMELSTKIDKTNYLVYFTSNGEIGTRIVALNENDEEIPLIDAGLGGDNPQNNQEVVSLIQRTVLENDKPLKIMLFGTQNTIDQTKIFALRLDDNLAYTPNENTILSDVTTLQTMHLTTNTELTTQFGQPFLLKVPRKKVHKNDIFTLYINGEAIRQKRAKNNKKIVLKYAAAKNLAAGDAFTVQVGRQLSYGKGKNKVLSSNIVLGEIQTVTVQ